MIIKFLVYNWLNNPYTRPFSNRLSFRHLYSSLNYGTLFTKERPLSITWALYSIQTELCLIIILLSTDSSMFCKRSLFLSLFYQNYYWHFLNLNECYTFSHLSFIYLIYVTTLGGDNKLWNSTLYTSFHFMMKFCIIKWLCYTKRPIFKCRLIFSTAWSNRACLIAPW
jgi:hypothetical protein